MDRNGSGELGAEEIEACRFVDRSSCAETETDHRRVLRLWDGMG